MQNEFVTPFLVVSKRKLATAASIMLPSSDFWLRVFHNPLLYKCCQIYWLFLTDFIVSSSELQCVFFFFYISSQAGQSSLKSPHCSIRGYV